MKIVSVGGGPAGLYFAILMKKAFPDSQIDVFERNRFDDTFGWGVVFSDETLGNFEEADEPTFADITDHFRYWQEIETYYGGTRVVSRGHGFAALSRKRLLMILQKRCRQLDVGLHFQHEIDSLDDFADADLIVGADGVNSRVRESLSRHFEPRIDWRHCKFCWLGTDKPLAAFTFIFKPTQVGLFQVHAYPFAADASTWIVECREEVWRQAGLDAVDEEQTVEFCEALFAEELDGHRLLANRSLWRTFPTVRCKTWHHGNVVLLGDAAHTAHFSIGSGTKLAMEDAMALVGAFEKHGTDDLPATLQAYEDDRWVDVVKVQKAAQTSLEWFENSARYVGQQPVLFTFNLMTRSKRITYDNLRQRDPELIRQVDHSFAELVAAPPTATGDPPPPISTPFRLRDLQLVNRVVVSPMCQYSADNGKVNDWHLVHLGSRAIGGAGLVMTEMTDVLPEGRISLGCAGMYAREHVDAWRHIVEFVHRNSEARIGIQLAHAGRKGSTRLPWEAADTPLTADEGAWQCVAPSAIPFYPDWPVPKEMTRKDMDRVVRAFVEATERSLEAGFDLIELHMAHGYLLSSFLSPLANQRSDEYGGRLDNRMRFPMEVFRAVRHAWPSTKPLSVRISATDWMPDGSGMTADDSVFLARALKEEGCDIIDVSSGGNSPLSRPQYGRMYQVPFAEKIRYEVDMPVMTVGALLGADHANTVLAAGRADLAVMARAHLRDPYLTLHAAEQYEYWEQTWPSQYLPAKPQPPKPQQRRREEETEADG